MRIVFCGTPDYAVPSLKKIAAKHELVAVVSQPDQPKGRSRTPTPPPVVSAALALGFSKDRIFQPKSINKPEILEALRALQPDILCVIAYGNILKKDALELGRHFPINAHASLLPKYRGAAPIQAAILNGETETGVCIIKMEAGLDSGPVLLRRAIPIEPRETAGTLHDKLAELSAECFIEALEKIGANSYVLEPQDDSRATYAGKLEKSSGAIDWSRDPLAIERQIRAMTPWPGAWTTIVSASPDVSPLRIRIAEPNIEHCTPDSKAIASEQQRPGCKIVLPKGDSYLAAFWAKHHRALTVSRVQPEGKREMSVAEFLRGSGKSLEPQFEWK